MMKQAVWRTWRRKRETNLRWMSGAWRDVGRSMGIPWGNVRWRLRGLALLSRSLGTVASRLISFSLSSFGA
jgi:hypothetical protein